jgi:hypothetical protein
MLRQLLRDFLGIDNQPLPPAASTPSEYDLKIDAQVEKFVENKQKLTYFLITASVTVIAFIVNFAVSHPTPLPSMVIFAAIAGLFTSGFSLLNLRFEHRSYNLHLKYRYQRKTWDDLTPKEQTQWDKLNRQATFFIESAFVFLFIEILFSVIFLVMFFAKAP